MVFPSFLTGPEAGHISQITVYTVLLFSYFLNRWKKLIAIILILVLTLLITKTAFSFSYVPGGCGTLCMANNNYYGSSYGRTPYYFYPRLPFHSFAGPQRSYYNFPPSPYRSNSYCSFCGSNFPRNYYPMW